MQGGCCCSVVVNHLRSKNHEESKERLKKKELRERDIAGSLKAHDDATNRKGETLPEAQNVYRARVVMTFMSLYEMWNTFDEAGLS